MTLVLRVIKSFFSMPVWVVIWLLVFLVPANFSGFFLLQYQTGWWVAVLGSTAIAVNMVIIFINGGMSKVLAIPHLIFWIPLQIILFYRWMSVPDLSGFEQNYLLVILIINGISLTFDVYDTRQWWLGNNKIFGYEDEAPLF